MINRSQAQNSCKSLRNKLILGFMAGLLVSFMASNLALADNPPTTSTTGTTTGTTTTPPIQATSNDNLPGITPEKEADASKYYQLAPEELSAFNQGRFPDSMGGATIPWLSSTGITPEQSLATFKQIVYGYKTGAVDGAWNDYVLTSEEWNNYINHRYPTTAGDDLAGVSFSGLTLEDYKKTLYTNRMNSIRNFGQVLCNAADSLVPYGKVINAIAFIAGTFFLTSGVIRLKKHGENPANSPLAPIIMSMLGGAACMALPSIGQIIFQSLAEIESSGGVEACKPAELLDISATDINLATIVTNLFTNINVPLQYLVSGVCFIVGAFYVATGLMRAAKYGTDAKASSPKVITAYLLFGSILLSAGQMADIVVMTLLGDKDYTQDFKLAWGKIDTSATGGGADDYKNIDMTITAVLSFIQIIGIIAFARGWMVIKTAVENGQGMAQGLTHVIGGALAINIKALIKTMDRTFGTNIVEM